MPDHRDDLPLRPAEHRLEEASLRALRSSLASDLFDIQKDDIRDYGVDARLAVVVGPSITNLRVDLQLKATTGAPNGDGGHSVQVARSNLNYLLQNPASVYVLYVERQDALYYRFADDVLREYEHSGTAWQTQKTITVRFHTRFDRDGQMLIHSVAREQGRQGRDWRQRWTVEPPSKWPAAGHSG